MTRRLRNLGLVAIVPLVLAGCGGGGGGGSTGTVTPPTTVPPTASIQSRISTPFATAFDAASTATPAHPATSDVPAVNATAEPIDN
jgi:hypothetical protein